MKIQNNSAAAVVVQETAAEPNQTNESGAHSEAEGAGEATTPFRKKLGAVEAEQAAALMAALGAHRETEVQVSPQGRALEAMMARTSQAADSRSPRERLLDAVRLQETRSASTNTVDSMTGLQPWDKNWVFQRGDEALLPPAALGGEEKSALASLVQEFQSLQGAMRGNDQAVSGAAPAAPRAVAEISAPKVEAADLSGAELERQLAQALSREAGPRAALGASAQALAVDEARSLEALSGDGLEVRVSTEGPRAPRPAERPALQQWGGGDYLEIRDALREARVPSGREALTRLDPKPATLPMGEAPVGTWRPGRTAGKNGLTPAQETAWRDAVAVSTVQGGLGRLNTTLNSTHVAGPMPREVSAWVTQGSMAQNRLSTEALVGIGSELKSLSAAGGGEMRIRLRPDHLGELSVRVNTRGNEVSLEILASDPQAKRIIEDSVGHLKESLAGQQLTLTKFDLGVAPSPTQSGLPSDFLGQQPGQQSAFGSEMGQSQFGRQNQSESDQGRSAGAGLARENVASPGAAQVASRFASASRGGGSGQIDVIA
jgi:hypothetical protein